MAHITAQSHTFSLDAVILSVLMWKWVGARLRQQVLGGACDPVFTLGVLGAQGAGRGHALDVPAERTVAGADPLSHRATRHNWVLFGAGCVCTENLLVIICMCQTGSVKHFN